MFRLDCTCVPSEVLHHRYGCAKVKETTADNRSCRPWPALRFSFFPNVLSRHYADLIFLSCGAHCGDGRGGRCLLGHSSRQAEALGAIVECFNGVSTRSSAVLSKRAVSPLLRCGGSHAESR